MARGAGTVAPLGVNPAFWRGRRVLVTGHTGFKGSWLCLWLQRLGAELSGFALPPADPGLFSAAGVAEGMASHCGDVRSAEALTAVLAATQPQIVIHLAAQALVRASYAEPLATYATNVMGLVHLCEAVRATPSVRVLLSVTSDKCYANAEHGRAFREDDALGGHDPYSSSKACAELVTAAYRDSFLAARPGGGVAVASARAGNVIGGGDWAADRLLPDLMRAFAAGRPARIRQPQAVRPWQHVLEPLAGYLQLAEALWRQPAAFAGAWNFGPAADDARPVGWLVERCAALWGAGACWQADSGPQPHEAGQLRLDSRRAAEQLGWRPRWDLQTALAASVDWYRAVHAGAAARALCLAQIARYEGEAE